MILTSGGISALFITVNYFHIMAALIYLTSTLYLIVMYSEIELCEEWSSKKLICRTSKNKEEEKNSKWVFISWGPNICFV